MLVPCAPSTRVCAQPAFILRAREIKSVVAIPCRAPESVAVASALYIITQSSSAPQMRKTYNLSSPKALADMEGREVRGGGVGEGRLKFGRWGMNIL